jgi:phytoene dehydrogenase-like protein
MFRVAYPDFSWDIPADPDKFQALLREKFPAEAKGIDDLFTEMRDLHRILSEVIRSQSTGGMPNVTTDDLTKLQGYTSKTLTEVLDLYISDPKLVAVWAQLAGFAGAEPEKVSALFFIAMWGSYYLGGYHYFTGGSEALAEALAAVTRERGGVIRTGSLVTEIVVEGNLARQVRTADGGCYDASYVISNANAPDTVHKLVGDDKFPADYVAKLDAMKVGLSAFVVFLGVDKDYSEQFKGAHEIMVNTGYDTAATFKAIRDCAPERTGFTIVNTTMIDPATAPANKNVIILTSQLAHECNSEWQWNESRAGYKAYKEQVARSYISRAETFLPELSKHVEVMEVATPLTIRGYTLNPQGSIFGWDNVPEQSTLSRLTQQTPVSNLYLAGAWTFPGGGQSAVIISGTIAARVILQAMSAP